MTSRKSWGSGKVERYVQGELYEVLGRGKKGPKKQSIKSQHQKKKPFKRAEEKAIEKMPLKKSRTISKVLTLTE